MKMLNLNLLSLTGIFLILLYIFHLGQIILKGITITYQWAFDVSTLVPEFIFKKSIIYSLYIISFIIIGILLSIRNEKACFVNYSNKNISFRYGLFVFFTSFPLELYYSIKKLIISKQEGYLSVLSIEDSGLLSLFSRFHLIGIVIMIMTTNSKKKSDLIFYFYSIYSLITLFSGSRMYQMVSLILVGYTWISSTERKFSLIKVLSLSVVGFLLLTFLNTLADIRATGVDDWTYFTNAFYTKLEENPLYDSLDEFGGTIYTVALTEIKVPTQLEYSRGSQFFQGIVTLLPNINGIFTAINNSSNYVLQLKTKAIGGSLVGELRYSFQFFDWLFAILIGFVINKVFDSFYKSLKYKNYRKAAYYVLPMFSIILWIRGTHLTVLRCSLYSLIYIYITSSLYRKIFLKKQTLSS